MTELVKLGLVILLPPFSFTLAKVLLNLWPCGVRFSPGNR
jgi:hypothetical protein